METSVGIRDRIFAAADSLYAESGRRNFPTVDAVRKRAQVNMNDASTCMKEWRRAQTSTVTAVPAQLPPALQESCLAALAALWKEATDVANDTLRTAQAGWELERTDIEVLSRQMAEACDLQAVELEVAHAEVTSLKARMDEMSSELINIRMSQAAAERYSERATQAKDAAEAKVLEVGQRVEEMRGERDTARNELAALRAELAGLHTSYREKIERIQADARADIEVAREKAEREGERLQNALTLALQQFGDLSGKGRASVQGTLANTRKTRKPNADGDASGDGSGEPAH